MRLDEIIEDLLAEQASLDEVVAVIDASDWSLPTPSPRWSITDQIGHLSYFDSTAALAINDPAAFRTEARALMKASLASASSGDDYTLASFRSLDPPDRLELWRANRHRLAKAISSLGDRDRVRWYGPSMGAKSFVTARLMEAWAHGQDVCDALGTEREPSDRLRHICQLGYITRSWSYLNRSLEPPAGEVVVELRAPSGATWSWGESSAATENSVHGDALDFCLVVTQRRNVADTSLTVSGELAWDWMHKAQAFAGPPTDGPKVSRSSQ